MSKKVCPVCNGSGKCSTCQGHKGGFSYVCKTCKDSGHCPRCHGEGVVKD